MKSGTWENPQRIRLGSGGFNPADVKTILDVFTVKKYVGSRPAENPQSKTEYRITESGRGMLKDIVAVVMKHSFLAPSFEISDESSPGLPELEEK